MLDLHYSKNKKKKDFFTWLFDSFRGSCSLQTKNGSVIKQDNEDLSCV